MSFWDDRLGPAKKAEPAQPVAPGSWWQTPQQQSVNHQQQAVTYNNGPQQQQEYAPKSSGLVKNRLQSDVSDTCPRCGSYDYVKIAAESATGSTYALPGASMRCMVCNYPGIDTSEGVIGSLTGTAAAMPVGNTGVVTHKVRERGGKNRNAFAGFNESSQADGSHVIRIM